MYPNQPQPQPPVQSPADYLNQIAPPTPKKQLFTPGPKLFLLIGAVLVVAVIVISIVVNLVVAAQRQPLQRLAARLQTTQEVVEGAQSKIRSSQLRTLNSNLQLFLTDTNRDIEDPLAKSGVLVDKLDKSIVSQESGDDIEARLEDARLNAVYDRTYAREMAYQLETLLALMKQIYSSTNSASLKEFLQKTYANLEPTQKSLAEFNAANG